MLAHLHTEGLGFAVPGPLAGELVDIGALDIDDPDLVAHFTRGCCWLLAAHLGQRLNLPLWVLDGHHVIVGAGDGWWLDVRGWQTTTEVIAIWSPTLTEDDWELCNIDHLFELLPPDDLPSWQASSDDDYMTTFGRSTMQLIVDRLLERHGVAPYACVR